jgi:hypothetical protein
MDLFWIGLIIGLFGIAFDCDFVIGVGVGIMILNV